MNSLKREFLELLDKDIEFRYAVAGYLGLSEILKRLDSLVEEQTRLREDFTELREEQTRLRKDFAELREDFTELREEQTRLRKDFAELREDFTELREEQTRLREDFNRMLEVIKDLKEGQIRLERRVNSLERGLKSLESAMISGFGELSKFAGLTFEEFVRKFLTASLRSSGDIPESAELRKAVVDGEEINIFLEEPLIVGEATGYAESKGEIFKLLKKAEVVRKKYSREPRKILVVLAAKEDVTAEMRKIAEKEDIYLIVGKAVK